MYLFSLQSSLSEAELFGKPCSQCFPLIHSSLLPRAPRKGYLISTNWFKCVKLKGWCNRSNIDMYVWKVACGFILWWFKMSCMTQLILSIQVGTDPIHHNLGGFSYSKWDVWRKYSSLVHCQEAGKLLRHGKSRVNTSEENQIFFMKEDVRREWHQAMPSGFRWVVGENLAICEHLVFTMIWSHGKLCIVEFLRSSTFKRPSFSFQFYCFICNLYCYLGYTCFCIQLQI